MKKLESPKTKIKKEYSLNFNKNIYLKMRYSLKVVVTTKGNENVKNFNTKSRDIKSIIRSNQNFETNL